MLGGKSRPTRESRSLFCKIHTSHINFSLYYTHLEITGGPCNLIGSNWCDLFTNRTISIAIYSQIAPFFALNWIFFPANEEATLNTKQPIRFQGLFKVTNQIAVKWKTKSIMWQILQIFISKTLNFELKMNLIWNRLSTASIRYLKSCIWFQPKLQSIQFNYHY